MKKNWKIIFAILLIIGGMGYITTDFRSAAFDITVGIALAVWWNKGRNKAENSQPASKIPLTSPTVSVTSPFIHTTRTSESSQSIAHAQTSSSLSFVDQPATKSMTPDYKFSVEIQGFSTDDEEPQNLDFYRDKLNSRKALTSFDTYVVLDCETSGLSPKSDEIIEIALIKYVKGELVDTFSSLVAPSRPISSRITEITWITNTDLENAPTIQEIIPKVWDFIDGFVLVGHNIPFDIGFLKTQFAKSGYEGRFNYVDTLQLARSAFPDFPNHKLSTCIEKLSLSDGQTHRAMGDTVCTHLLLEKCLSVLLEKKEQELAERRARKASANKEQKEQVN